MKKIDDYWHDYYCAAVTGLLGNPTYQNGGMIHEQELIDDAKVIADAALKCAQEARRVSTGVNWKGVTRK